jgi:hypothetical protein
VKAQIFLITVIFKAGGKKNEDGSSAATSLFSRKNWKRRYVLLQVIKYMHLLLAKLTIAYLKQETMVKYFKDVPTDGETALGYLNIDADSTARILGERNFVIATKKRMFHLVADTAVCLSPLF